MSAGLRNQIGLGLLVVWLLASALGYWWYQARYLTTYHSPDSTQSKPDEVRARLEAGWLAVVEEQNLSKASATLVHFSAPGCPCSEASLQHLRSLYEKFRLSGLQIVQATDQFRDFPEPVNEQVRKIVMPNLWSEVKAVPAAALFAEDGQLIYFGPYSSGASCGNGINFVDNELQQLYQQRNQQSTDNQLWPWINNLAFGCFCSTGQRT